MDYNNYDPLAARDESLLRLKGMGNARNVFLQKQLAAAAAEKAKAEEAQKESNRGWLASGLSGAAGGSMFGPVGTAIGGGLGLGLGLYSAYKNRKEGSGFMRTLKHPMGEKVDMNDVGQIMAPLPVVGGMAAKAIASRQKGPQFGKDKFGNNTADMSGMSEGQVGDYNANLEMQRDPTQMGASSYQTYQNMPDPRLQASAAGDYSDFYNNMG